MTIPRAYGGFGDGVVLTIALDDTVDANNSTTIPLGISATFTGTGTDVVGYSSVTAQFAADEDSATLGLRLEFSEDNVNWDFSHQHEFLANTPRVFQFSVHARFFRVVFVNGTTAQTFFRVQTILHRGTSLQEITRIDDSLPPDSAATTVRAAVVAQAAGAGEFIPVQATAGGNLKVSVEEVEPVTASGTITALNGTVQIDVGGLGSLALQITGTWVATVTFQGTVDGTNWETIQVVPLASGTAVTTTTGNGAWLVAAGGMNLIRCEATAFTSGTIQVNLQSNISASKQAAGAGGGGGGTEFNEDDPASGGEAGPAILGVRQDADTSPVSLDGDFHQFIFDSVGALKVNVKASALPTGAALSALQLANGHDVHVNNVGGGGAVPIQDGGNSITVDGVVTATAVGNVAHDAVDSGNPVKVGLVAREYAAEPPTVSGTADRVNAIATPQGIPYVLGGHPNVITREFMTNDGETNTNILHTAVGAGSHAIILGIEVLNDDATSVTVQARVGFGAVSVPAEPTTGAGVNGMVLTHPGLAPGSGVVRGNGSGIIGVGGSGEELRVTCGSPTSGQLSFLVTYYIATL